MARLMACPFCREIYRDDEERSCPCGLELVPMDELPPSAEVLAERGLQDPPEHRRLPLGYLGRGKGALLITCVAGIAAFFAPWLHETRPEIATLSGFQMARVYPYLWGGAVAWFVLFSLVLTRKTLAEMRGVRAITVVFAAMTLIEVFTLVAQPPGSNSRYLVVEISWGWGLYASALVSVVGIALGARFGGSLDRIERLPFLDQSGTPVKPESSSGEVVH